MQHQSVTTIDPPPLDPSIHKFNTLGSILLQMNDTASSPSTAANAERIHSTEFSAPVSPS